MIKRRGLFSIHPSQVGTRDLNVLALLEVLGTMINVLSGQNETELLCPFSLLSFSKHVYVVVF